jgi:hypothetical protein
MKTRAPRPTDIEPAVDHELLRDTLPRFVVYGRYSRKADKTIEKVRGVLRGDDNSDVEVVSIQVDANIQSSFFGLKSPEYSPPAYHNADKKRAKEPKKPFFRSLGRTSLPKSAVLSYGPSGEEYIDFPVSTDEIEPTIPECVLVLPEMTRFDASGDNYPVDTPVSEIEALCIEHNVPLIRLEVGDTEESLREKFESIHLVSV